MTEHEFLNLKELTVKRTYIGNLPPAQSQTPAKFVLKSEFLCGNWCNAIEASLDFGSNGGASGIGATISADMIPPNKAITSGASYCLHLSFGCQASTTFHTTLQPLAFMRLENWGTATEFDNKAHFIHLAGINEGDGKMFSMGTGGGAPTVAGTLRILIGTTVYYLAIASKAAID